MNEIKPSPIRKYEIITEALEDKIEEKKEVISEHSDVDHILELAEEVKEVESIIDEINQILTDKNKDIIKEKDNSNSNNGDESDGEDDDGWTIVIDSQNRNENELDKYPHLNIYREPIDFVKRHINLYDKITTSDLKEFLDDNLSEHTGRNYKSSSLTTIACAHFEYMIQNDMIERTELGVYRPVNDDEVTIDGHIFNERNQI